MINYNINEHWQYVLFLQFRQARNLSRADQTSINPRNISQLFQLCDCITAMISLHIFQKFKNLSQFKNMTFIYSLVARFPVKDVRANCFCASYCARKFTRHVMHERAR